MHNGNLMHNLDRYEWEKWEGGLTGRYGNLFGQLAIDRVVATVLLDVLV